MPIYEYQCTACGTELEKLQKISEPLLRECPECGKETLVKRISAPSFRLKGTGWYETDFKTGKRKHGTEDSKTPAGNGAENHAENSKNGDKQSGSATGRDGADKGSAEQQAHSANKTKESGSTSSGKDAGSAGSSEKSGKTEAASGNQQQAAQQQ